MCVRGDESAYRVPQYREMLLMLEVLKVHGYLSIQSIATHVKGVKSSSICTITISTETLLRDPCHVLAVLTYIVLMVWLKKPQTQLSKMLFGLKIS